MPPIVVDVPWSARVSVRVRLSVAHNHEPYQMAAPIVMPFGVWTWVDPRGPGP